MASSGDDGRVVVDLRSAAEAAARTGEEDTHAQPIHEIESLCMRCGENVSVPRSLPLVFSFSVLSGSALLLRVLRPVPSLSLWLGHLEADAYADPSLPGGTWCACSWRELLTLIST